MPSNKNAELRKRARERAKEAMAKDNKTRQRKPAMKRTQEQATATSKSNEGNNGNVGDALDQPPTKRRKLTKAEQLENAKKWAAQEYPSGGAARSTSRAARSTTRRGTNPVVPARTTPSATTATAVIPTLTIPGGTSAGTGAAGVGRTASVAYRNNSVPSTGNNDSSDEEEDETQAAVPFLSPRLVQQVTNNAAALQQGQPTNDVPPQDEGGVDDEEYDVDYESPEGSESSNLIVSFGAVSLFVVLVAMAINFAPSIPSFSKCYLDSTGTGCSGTAETRVFQCPEGGTCQDGKLVACTQLFHDINWYGTECEPTIAKTKFEETLAKSLLEISLEGRSCDDTTWPFIEYWELRATDPDTLLEPSLELVGIMADSGFGIEVEDNVLKVQLAKRYQKKPARCQLQDDTKFMMAWVFSTMKDFVLSSLVFCAVIVWNLFGWSLSCALQSPWHFIGFVVVVVAWWTFTQMKEKKKDAKALKACVDENVDKVLQKLEANGGSPVRVDKFRIELGKEYAGTNKKKMLHWKKSVWPQIRKKVGATSWVVSATCVVNDNPVEGWKSNRRTTITG